MASSAESSRRTSSARGSRKGNSKEGRTGTPRAGLQCSFVLALDRRDG
jgi:hypothetical protein